MAKPTKTIVIESREEADRALQRGRDRAGAARFAELKNERANYPV